MECGVSFYSWSIFYWIRRSVLTDMLHDFSTDHLDHAWPFIGTYTLLIGSHNKPLTATDCGAYQAVIIKAHPHVSLCSDDDDHWHLLIHLDTHLTAAGGGVIPTVVTFTLKHRNGLVSALSVTLQPPMRQHSLEMIVLLFIFFKQTGIIFIVKYHDF